MLSVYISCPISGRRFSEVFADYDRLTAELRTAGFRILSPMIAKDDFRSLDALAGRQAYALSPICTPHAIMRRDLWMVRQADVLFCDLTGVEAVSIGCCMEIGWAYAEGVYSVVVMEEANVHRHAFILEGADVIFQDSTAAMRYLRCLAEAEGDIRSCENCPLETEVVP